ncbi:hypothetical protein CLPUN_49620 [Clostridium puniceum]|uniref:DUF1189 domain-containing protein n=1 Tax=Clostridium puniceum TaxID=29367 RepID=A0A1S8T1E7_9CLOT|nr:DUF1189 family protein [Clostridium puniceum]OOM71434.1 hypothetical protein CLPUN_49620 [Clostridium puniceum]
MEYKTNFFRKVVTSIYDIKVFSKYAKEGIFRSISYAMLLTLILVGIKEISEGYKINGFELKGFMSQFIVKFGINFIDLLFDCLIVVSVALLFSILMRMVVKYIALYSLTIYAATLPLIIKTILETVNPNISFDTMFIIGTLTYVVLILKHIKDEIIKNFT